MKGFIRKFTFPNLDLAFKVREKMRNELIKFDVNNNKQFEEN